MSREGRRRGPRAGMARMARQAPWRMEPGWRDAHEEATRVVSQLWNDARFAWRVRQGLRVDRVQDAIEKAARLVLARRRTEEHNGTQT